MAEQGSKSAKPVSMDIVSRISRFIRLGRARNRNLHGNPFPLFCIRMLPVYQDNRRELEINVLGWTIDVQFIGFICRIDEILDDGDEDDFELEAFRKGERAVSENPTNQPQKRDEGESDQ